MDEAWGWAGMFDGERAREDTSFRRDFEILMTRLRSYSATGCWFL